MYKVIKIENTYAWIIETADSKVNNKIWIKIKIGINRLLIVDPIFPKRVNSKCPAIMLAVKRTVKVIGRIIFLVVSIQIINGIKILGVPWGTKWENIWFVLLIHPNINNLNHSGIAIDQFITKCLVLVKI